MQSAHFARSGSLSELFKGFRDVRIFDEHDLGFTAVIAVHDTTLGPALGGCRRKAYDSLWEACVDVSRLARGMTYKAAMTDYYKGGIPLGGGKAVMIPRKTDKRLRHAQFQAMGEFIDTFGGTYVSAEDVGTSVADVHEMAKRTKHVTGEMVGHPYGGDPSPYTALGVLVGMQGAWHAVSGSNDLSGRTIYVEGIGKVGFALLELLCARGARLFVSNRMSTPAERLAIEKARSLGARVVILGNDGRPIEFPSVEIYAPCALGGVVSPDAITAYPDTLRLIAGAANNVLLDPARDGTALLAKGITYAPDYVINNRGLWDVYHQVMHNKGGTPYSESDVLAGCAENEALLYEIVMRAQKEGTCPHVVADRMAEDVINKKKIITHT